ncbi:hypothetical protein [Streptomyces sp. NPDC000983]|uniref:hypothetical protein n=1 Tax=Streptomyces sp. NPDC000983 TaxID=3154373 RepID=UPI00331AD168
MTEFDVVVRGRVGGGGRVERVLCHPLLPLAVAWDVERPAVRVLDLSAGRLREVGCVGGESAPYERELGWNRMRRTPAAAWHPELPSLVVATEEGLVGWGAEGGVVPFPGAGGVAFPDSGGDRGTAFPEAGVNSAGAGAPGGVRYRDVAFSPGGRSLWASPSPEGGSDSWERSDVIDPGSGRVLAGAGTRWDTGVAAHPGGGLVATLRSDQGATHVIFGRVADEAGPAPMRVLRRALILDADGYGTPVFSADGRHLAVRGNAYFNSVDVFAFPSLERVLSVPLGEPSPGFPYPDEWLAEMRSWSRQNIAFGPRPGELWIGTPKGTLVAVGVDGGEAVEHDVLTGAPVTALDATATGDLLMADGQGDLTLLAVRSGTAPPDRGEPAAAVAAFLASTSEVPEDGADLQEHLVITDGDRSWAAEDLATVDTAAETDPSWLQIQAAVNRAGGEGV